MWSCWKRKKLRCNTFDPRERMTYNEYNRFFIRYFLSLSLSYLLSFSLLFSHFLLYFFFFSRRRNRCSGSYNLQYESRSDGMHWLFRLCRGIDISRCNCQIHSYRWKAQQSLITDSTYRNINVIICNDSDSMRRDAIDRLKIPLDKQHFVFTRKSIWRVILRLHIVRCIMVCKNLSFELQEESITSVQTKNRGGSGEKT